MDNVTNSEDPDEMPLFAKSKIIFRERKTMLFENHSLLPLNVWYELSQVYFSKPEGRIH